MTTIFRTLNSTYELDRENKRIRRLAGENQPTPNQGDDGEWQEYESLIKVHSRVPNSEYYYLIDWDGRRATQTSVVVDEFERD